MRTERLCWWLEYQYTAVLPPVHPAVGYLCYAAYARLTRGDAPDNGPARSAVFGAIAPDLVDKPLWLAGVVDVGRTIGHSLLFTGPVLGVLWLVTWRWNRQRLGTAFAIGYLSHPAADVPWHVLSGEYHELGFLLWPVTHMPQYTGTTTLGTVPGLGTEVTTLWLEAMILIAGVALWWRDGQPGLESGDNASS